MWQPSLIQRAMPWAVFDIEGMFSRIAPLLLLFLAGAAALSWQVLWHLDLSLALGVSAQGAALTVATVMLGMASGTLWAGRRWSQGRVGNPWRVYACLELGIGCAAWLPRLSTGVVEQLDVWVYHAAPSMATSFGGFVLALTLGPACFLMGATFPLIGIIAKQAATPLSRLYAANTLGAACGSLLVALLLLPSLGRVGSGGVIFAVDLSVVAMAYALSRRETGALADMPSAPAPPRSQGPALSLPLSLVFCAVTGFATFTLEVAWFRLLRGAWLSTSDSFAVMLFCFLVGLGLGAFVSKLVTRPRAVLPVILCLAAVAIWLGTPLIERFDLWSNAGGDYGWRMFARIAAASLAMGPAIVLLGISLPALLDARETPRQWAWLYSVNTLGAVVGSLLAGWWLVGWLGPVKTAWCAGGLLVVVAIPAIQTWALRVQLGVLAAIAFAIAQGADSGIGSKRVQGPTSFVRREHQVLAHQNGPDVTTSVVRTRQGFTMLFIDGYAATGEVGNSTGYMAAMGRLPMLLHPQPLDALVICFGSGQTVRAVLDEAPRSLTVVDLNPAVFQFADRFASNGGALKDPRVSSFVMDGRAWMRRSPSDYDVITLEPMPPFFAGSNSLYSVEFYTLIHQRLRQDGFAAQWFPIHLLSPSQARAVAAAFVQVFPHAILWFDPQSADASGHLQQGILIGNKGEVNWQTWPGFARAVTPARAATQAEVSAGVMLTSRGLAEYVRGVTPVTDDNQRLSYGADGLHHHDLTKGSTTAENMAILKSYSAMK